MIKNGWGITQDELENYICSSDSWETAYLRLREKSRVVKDKSVMLFDKTPKYLLMLDQVMEKIPEVPCIVIAKEPKGVIWSWIKRSELDKDEALRYENLKQYAQRYISYYKGYERAVKRFPDRILLVHYGTLCVQPYQEVKRLFNFLGMSSSRKCMKLKSEYGVYGSKVSKQYIFEHEKHLSEQNMLDIDELTKPAKWNFVQGKKNNPMKEITRKFAFLIRR